MKIFALTTRGLETITRAEMLNLPAMHVDELAYRRVHATYTGNLVDVLRLRTVDDVFLEVAHWSDIDHKRAMLPIFTHYASTLELDSLLVDLKQVRPIPNVPIFSITANFVGKRNYNADEIKHAIAQGILSAYPAWHYDADDSTSHLNLRVFIEHDNALVGLRIGATPLHRRTYKQHSLQGSLKAPVASAMLQFINASREVIVLDPFSGSGTIVIEAQARGFTAIGGDSNHDVLMLALHNAQDANATCMFHLWDARSLPLKNNSVDAIVSNPPWGRQISVDDSLKNLYHASFDEMRRVVKSGGDIVLLTTLPELIPAVPEHQLEISLYGQRPMILHFSNR